MAAARGRRTTSYTCHVAIFFLAIFANFLALGAVLDPGDAAGTARRLVESQATFRLGTLAFLAIVLLDVMVAWALNVLFRAVHADLSLLSAWFRLGYTVMLGVALVFLHVALLLVGDSAAAAGSTDAQVLLALQVAEPGPQGGGPGRGERVRGHEESLSREG